MMEMAFCAHTHCRMTTVGYGDVAIRTTLGRFVAVTASLFGTLYMAMPIAIIGSTFFAAFEKYKFQR